MAQLYRPSTDSNTSRREFLTLLGLAGMGLCLQGCNACNGPKASGKQLRFYGTGTLDIEEAGWERLKKDLGITLKFEDNGNDTGPVITKMIAGNAATEYDMGGLQGGAERELAEAGKILPWDLEKIPNWKSVWDWASAIPYTKWQGKQYGLPVVINADSMIYLPEYVGEIDTYAAVFDPKLKGKTAMEDAWINSVIFTAIFLKENALQKIIDPGDLTEDELGGVMEFLIKKKKDGQFRTFWNGWEQGLNLIVTREVHVMTGWEPIVVAARKGGVNAKYAVPKEGYEGWSNDLLLHSGAKERGLEELAHMFANWELSGYYGCSLATKRGYVVPADTSVDYAQHNPTEFDLNEQKQISQNVQNKFQKMKGQVYWQNVRPKNYRSYEEWWSRLTTA